MAKITINRPCYRCNGSGVTQRFGGPEVTCAGCGGSGEILLASIDLSDLEDINDDILDKCIDIFEKVNE